MMSTVGLVHRNNAEYLQQHANTIKKKNLDPFFKDAQEKSKGVLQKAYEYLPNISNRLPEASTAGQYAGKKISDAHGETIAHSGIEKVARFLFSNLETSPLLLSAVVELSKSQLTSYVLPAVEVGLTAAGGVSASAGLAVIQYVAAKALGKSASQVTIEDLEFTAEKLSFKDGQAYFGDVLISETTWESVAARTAEYAMCQTLQGMKIDEVEEFLSSNVYIRDNDNKLILEDGYKLNRKERDDLVQAIRYLKDDNAMHEFDEIGRTIRLISSHTKQPSNDPIDKRVVNSEGKLYLLPTEKSRKIAMSTTYEDIERLKAEYKKQSDHKAAFQKINAQIVEEVELRDMMKDFDLIASDVTSNMPHSA